DDEQTIGCEDGLGGLPVSLELVERLPEPGRERVGNVVVARDRQHRGSQGAEICGRRGVLVRLSAVREVSACDDEFGLDSLDQGSQAALGGGSFRGADVEVREVQEPCWMSRTSGYTHVYGERDYRDLRRPLSRSAGGRSDAQEAPRRAAHDGRGRGARALGIAFRST